VTSCAAKQAASCVATSLGLDHWDPSGRAKGHYLETATLSVIGERDIEDVDRRLNDHLLVDLESPQRDREYHAAIRHGH
jgi:hypothetical protein